MICINFVCVAPGLVSPGVVGVVSEVCHLCCHGAGLAFVSAVLLLPRPHRGRARYCNAHVCLFVCLCVCLFVCPCFRKISKCNISAISQPIIMKLGIHITYGYSVTDKYFQNFRSKVKVVGRRKVKNVIWPYLGNEVCHL